jgi:hypothetical protein
MNAELKNISSRSIILAPFNSTINEESQLSHQQIKKLLLSPSHLKFNPRCREVNRQYEQNNNAQLDNGVYND